MPNPDILRNTLALGAEVDLRALAGLNVFDRAAGNYSLPSTAGLYWDVLALLHGYASSAGQDLSTLVNGDWTGLGTFTCGIDENDLFYLESSLEDFSIGAAGDPEVFGFPVGGTGLVGGGAPFRHTASNPWQRGIMDQPGLTIVPDVSPAFTTPTARRVQCLPVWLRERGVIADADDVFNTLTIEDIDIATNVHWLVRPDGRVEANWPAGAYPDVTWTSAGDALMRLLGFDGTETSSVDGLMDVQVGTYPAAPFLAPTRMASWLRSRVEDDSKVARMADGSHASSRQGPYEGWNLRQRVDGRVGSTEDLQEHLRRFLGYALPGRPMTIYPQWGDLDAVARGSIDTRRHLDLVDAPWVGGGPGTGTLTPYDLLQTAENDTRAVNARVGGRLLVVRAASDRQRRAEDYGGRQLDQYQEIEFEFDADLSR